MKSNTWATIRRDRSGGLITGRNLTIRNVWERLVWWGSAGSRH